MAIPTCDDEIREAFTRINPTGLLAWSVLDQKSEKFVTTALTAAFNCSHRGAFAEWNRYDLALIRGDGVREIRGLYQAKCVYLSDYKESDYSLTWPLERLDAHKPKKDRAWYRGGSLRWDIEKSKPMGQVKPRGLWYILDVEDPACQAKYYRRSDKAKQPNRILGLDSAVQITQKLVGLEAGIQASSMWSEVTSGTRVRVHLVVFGTL